MEIKVMYGDAVLTEVPLSGAVTDKISRATEALQWVERVSKTVGPVRIVGWSEEFRCIVNVAGPVLSWRHIEGGGAKDAISAIESVRDLIENGCPKVQDEYPLGKRDGEYLPDRVVNGVNVDAVRRLAMREWIIDVLQRASNVLDHDHKDTKSALRYIREEIKKVKKENNHD